MKYVLMILAFAVVSSCESKKKNELQYFLTGNGHKFWHLKENIHHEYCYYKEGNFSRGLYSDKKLKRIRYVDPHMDSVLGKPTWKITADSMIVLYGHIPCKILELNDTVFVYAKLNGKHKDTVTCYKSAHQEIGF